MASQARVIVLNEVRKEGPDKWSLCLQWCRYEYGEYGNGEEKSGYRFIWRRPNGNLQGARGQARIPSIADMMELISEAIRNGWGHYIAPEHGPEEATEQELKENVV